MIHIVDYYMAVIATLRMPCVCGVFVFLPSVVIAIIDSYYVGCYSGVTGVFYSLLMIFSLLITM